ncbi:hypothetical protein M0R45_002235 [Rubus argutus]|uniref:Uncharacterized protein n=1 Tax=Rubus argutus TaxID=59490 RepID=A0AAW1VHK0_RUBAR
MMRRRWKQQLQLQRSTRLTTTIGLELVWVSVLNRSLASMVIGLAKQRDAGQGGNPSWACDSDGGFEIAAYNVAWWR